MSLVTWSRVDSAAADMRAGIAAWRLSRLLAWQDIKQRYRRSTLGPIWLTLSSGIQMLTMSVLSSFLFNSSVQKSLPFVCAGMLFWGLITQMIMEGANLFLLTSSYLTQIKCPLTVFVMQMIWRNLIVVAHNSVTYIVVAVIFAVMPGASIILWPLGMALVLICLAWMGLVCAIISARYRDVPVIIQNTLGILFWFTPLMYFPEQLGTKQYLTAYNPFTHMIALVRAPLLGGAPTIRDWLIVLVLAIVGWAGTFLFFARFRARVVYWL
jgi:lipopolysaccharide transport system permease protein